MPVATPLTGSLTIHPSNDVNDPRTIVYTPEERKYIDFRRMRLISARDSRDVERDEWDGMPFLDYIEVLKRADDQYVAPRKNAQDTSINLGTIRDKDTSLVEYAQDHTFEPVGQVFDQDNDMIDELAETGEDLLRKSFELEDFSEAKAKLIYRSIVAFGTALVQDDWVERWILKKTLKNGFRAGMGSDSAQWDTQMVKALDGAQAKLWDIRKCYPGDIRKFFMNGPQGQPYFFTVEYESYDMVKQWFGNWDRWDFVPKFVVPTPEVSASIVFSPWWTLRPISMNYVEIIRYYDPIANEFAITLNGVDMLPLMKRETVNNDGQPVTLISGFPLTEVSPSGAIPFAKYDLEPMHDLFYSKSQPAKMRVTADVENMLMKLFIQMFKQKAKPTMGNMSGKQFGPEITNPGTIINDVRDGELFAVLPNFQGAAPADFTFYESVKKELDKQSIERTWQGMDSPTPVDDTATATMNSMKAQSLKVAALFDGIMYGNRQLYWLRMYNIMRHWTQPIDQRVDQTRKNIVNIYRTVTMTSEGEGGQRVTKKIIFTKDTPKLPKGKKHISVEDSRAIHQKELDHKEDTGNDIRFVHLHPELLSTMPLTWTFTSVPVPNGNDPLSYMMFAKQIQDAQSMFGPQSLNVKRLKHRFAQLTGNDFDTLFLSDSEMQQSEQEQGAAQPGAPMAQGAAQPQGTPSPLNGTVPPNHTPPSTKKAAAPTPAGVMNGRGPASAIKLLMK